jgi:amino acid transporter
MAGFAFVGVEIIAASALEAKWPTSRTRPEQPNERGDVQPRKRHNVTLVGETIRFSAVWIPVFAAIAYTVAGCVVASDIKSDDCLLGRQSWVSETYPNGSLSCNPNGIPYRLSNGSVFYNGSIVTDATSMSRLSDITNINGTSIAPFVAIAKRSKIPGLENAFNFFLIFTAVTCANTNLYVASRTFFGLTSRLRGGKNVPLYIQFFAWFGKTNSRNVPMRAMVYSAVFFWWVPFLSLAEGNSKSGSPVAQVCLICSRS